MVDGGGNFEVFTHMDYAVRCWPTEQHGPFDPRPFEDGFRQAMRAIAASGRALEMNTGRPLRAGSRSGGPMRAAAPSPSAAMITHERTSRQLPRGDCPARTFRLPLRTDAQKISGPAETLESVEEGCRSTAVVWDGRDRFHSAGLGAPQVERPAAHGDCRKRNLQRRSSAKLAQPRSYSTVGECTQLNARAAAATTSSCGTSRRC